MHHFELYSKEMTGISVALQCNKHKKSKNECLPAGTERQTAGDVSFNSDHLIRGERRPLLQGTNDLRLLNFGWSSFDLVFASIKYIFLIAGKTSTQHDHGHDALSRCQAQHVHDWR